MIWYSSTILGFYSTFQNKCIKEFVENIFSKILEYNITNCFYWILKYALSFDQNSNFTLIKYKGSLELEE